MYSPSNIVLSAAAMCFLMGCQPASTPKPIAGGFLPITSKSANGVIGGISCARAGDLENSNATRSDGVGFANGLRGHPVRLCEGGTAIGEVIVWTGTNAAGNRLEIEPASLSGQPLPVTDTAWNPELGENTVTFNVTTDAGAKTCTATKPAGGISPFKLAVCS